MKCDICQREAVTYIRYNGTHLCSEHFCAYVEKRVKREIRQQVDLHRGDVIGVAVSGGKDSMVTLHTLSNLFGKFNGIEVHCITVDEGIEGYRPEAMALVKDYCHARDIPFHGISFRDTFGLTMDQVAPLAGKNSPCTYCGVFRRKCMNEVARDIGAKYLATGHNLDDMAQSIMMDVVRGDVDRLARLGPHKAVRPGLIPRFYPLRSIPEKESLLYAMLAGIPHHTSNCPYWEAALRNEYREMVDGLEARSPGTKFSILSSYDQLRPLLRSGLKSPPLRTCACGEPALGKRCKACELSDKMRKQISEVTEGH